MNWSTRPMKMIRAGLWGCAYIAAFVCFCYLAFPYDRLKQLVETQYNAQLGEANGSRLAIEDLSWSMRFPGVVAEGVELELLPDPDEPETKRPQLPVRLESVRASVSPISYLLGRREVDLSVKGLGGELEADFSEGEEATQLELELDQVELGRVPQLADLLGVPVLGRFSGEVDVSLPGGNWSKADGRLDLSGEGVMLGTKEAKIAGMLPAAHLGDVSLRGELVSGRLKLEQFTTKGKDVELSATGEIRLREPIPRSALEVDLKLGFSKSYKSRDESTKALFESAPGSKLPGLFDMTTKTMLKKTSDGKYETRVTGAIAKPRLRPGGAASTSRSKARARRRSRARARPARARKSED